MCHEGFSLIYHVCSPAGMLGEHGALLRNDGSCKSFRTKENIIHPLHVNFLL